MIGAIAVVRRRWHFDEESRSWRLTAGAFQNGLYIASTVKDPNNLNGLNFWSINDHELVNAPETQRFVGEITAEVSDAGRLSEAVHGSVEFILKRVRTRDPTVVADKLPDVFKVAVGSRRQQIPAHLPPRPERLARRFARALSPSINWPVRA